MPKLSLLVLLDGEASDSESTYVTIPFDYSCIGFSGRI